MTADHLIDGAIAVLQFGASLIALASALPARRRTGPANDATCMSKTPSAQPDSSLRREVLTAHRSPLLPVPVVGDTDTTREVRTTTAGGRPIPTPT